MRKTIKILGAVSVAAILDLAVLVTTLETNVNPTKLIREAGADCQTQQAIFEYYATIKFAYMTGKRELETLVSGLSFNSESYARDWLIDGLDSVADCYGEERIK